MKELRRESDTTPLLYNGGMRYGRNGFEGLIADVG